MSTKNNAFVAIAALSLGLTVQAGAKPVCDSMLNDLNVTTFGMSEVDAAGRVLVIVGITSGGVEVIRPVCDVRGDVRLFSGADMAVALSKRSKLGAATVVRFVRFQSVGTVGDPVASLKAKHKATKIEGVASAKSVTLLASKVSAGIALGWNTATGTPEATEYADLVQRQFSIAEWNAANVASLAALAASLTAAGVNPDTYLPL